MTDLHIEGTSSQTWLRCWEQTGREPFAHPAYVDLQTSLGGQPIAVQWTDDNGNVLLPLVLRSLPDTSWAKSFTDRGWIDAVSPYGYGGPFVSGAPNLTSFLTDLLAWMREARVLTGFLRTSLGVPLPTSGVVTGYEAIHLADNVVVDLSRSPTNQWHTYEHKVRKNVNKARRAGLRVEVRDQFASIDTFVAIYHGTMERRDAAQSYYFDINYFTRIRDDLAGSYWVADVLDSDDHTVSTELVLLSDRHCYSFLGGTLHEAFPMAPNDLLKHEVITHAAARGLVSYVLGGGYQPGDGIFRYKRAFDPEGVVPFVGVRLTSDAAAYDALCAARSGGDPGAFFPAYRGL